MQAERKLASVPASRARKPSRARSCRRSGARAPIPPSWMPIELKLANPQRAKLAITNDRSSSCRAELCRAPEGDQLVEHGARAEQPADGAAVLPGDAQQVGDRGQDPAEDRLERRVPNWPSPRLMRAIRPRNAISMAAMLSARWRPSRVPRAAASSRLASGRSSAGRTCPGSPGVRLGHQHLGEQDRPRGRHDHGRQDVPGLDAEREVRRHHPARDVGHARGHHRQQLGFVSLGRYGRIVSGASVWPRKSEAATLSDSAPLVPISQAITTAKTRTTHCITPR